MSISAEERNAIMQMSDEELAAGDAADDKIIAEALAALLSEESDAKTPEQKASTATSSPSSPARISSEERNAISQMSEEELVKFIAGIDKEMQEVFSEFVNGGHESTKPKRGEMAKTAKKPEAPQSPKKQPAQDIWTVKAGQSTGYLVPHELNPRHRSPERRYRNKEVAHGFPVKHLREFFFFSRRLASAAYDAPNRRLFLKFDATSLYQYFNVPEKVVRDLLNAVSPGSYAYHHICYRFKYERIAFLSAVPEPRKASISAEEKRASLSEADKNELSKLSKEERAKKRAEFVAELEATLESFLGKEDTQTPANLISADAR